VISKEHSPHFLVVVSMQYNCYSRKAKMRLKLTAVHEHDLQEVCRPKVEITGMFSLQYLLNCYLVNTVHYMKVIAWRPCSNICKC